MVCSPVEKLLIAGSNQLTAASWWDGPPEPPDLELRRPGGGVGRLGRESRSRSAGWMSLPLTCIQKPHSGTSRVDRRVGWLLRIGRTCRIGGVRA